METGILETIPKYKEESISIDDICDQCNTSKDITYKTLKFMSSMGYTKEVKDGYFVHCDNSLELCQGGNAYYTLNLFMDNDLGHGRYKFAEYLKGKPFDALNGKSFLEVLH